MVNSTDEGGHGGKVKIQAETEVAVPGRWHIVSMSQWDEDYLNEEVQAFIEFDAALCELVRHEGQHRLLRVLVIGVAAATV